MPNDTAKVNIYGQLCRSYAIHIGNFNLANKYLDSVKILSNRLQYENGTIYSFFLQGLIYQESRNYKEALDDYEKASQYYLKHGDSMRAFNAVQGMAQIYGNQGDFEKSLELHFFMAEFFERKNALYLLAGSFRSIGNIFRKIKKYEDSKKYHNKSLAILKAQGLEASYAMGLQNLANVYVSTGDNGTALELYKKALQVIRLTGNKNREAFILTNMGYLFGELNQFQKAIEYQLEAVSIWNNLSQDYNAIESLDNLGSLYFRLKKYDKAESFFKKALPLTKEAGSKTVTAELYRELSEVYVAKGDYKNAHMYNSRFWMLKDSIFNIENAKQISELQTKYEAEKKDQQIILLAQEKEVQQKEAQRQASLKMHLLWDYY